MAILVTGGAGYIGSHTSIELIKSGYDVIILDNFYNSKPEALNRIKKISEGDFKFYECDIRDKAGLDKVFAENDIEAVIHFAGLKAVGESCRKPLEYYENNIGGTVTLCEAMRDAGCKKIVFSSSATVYGSNNPSPLREDMPAGGTTNPYGTTKLYIETILSDLYASDNEWSVVILRYFNPIGAHESGLIGEDPKGIPNNLLPYIAKVAIGALPCLSVFGNDYNTHDGTGVRDYIHVVDLAIAHLHALERANKVTGVEHFNIGTGVGYSVLDIVHAYEEAIGEKINYKIVDRRPGDIDECYADPTRAKELLGWQATRGIKEMCRDSANWQKNNPNGYDS